MTNVYHSSPLLKKDSFVSILNPLSPLAFRLIFTLVLQGTKTKPRYDHYSTIPYFYYRFNRILNQKEKRSIESNTKHHLFATLN